MAAACVWRAGRHPCANGWPPRDAGSKGGSRAESGEVNWRVARGVAVVVLIVLAALLWFALPLGNDQPEPADPTRAPPQSEGVPEAKAPSGAKAPDESILPVKAKQPDAGMCVVIPKIGVDARVIRLGLNEDGSLQVPQEWDLPGWRDAARSNRPGGHCRARGFRERSRSPLRRQEPGATRQGIGRPLGRWRFEVRCQDPSPKGGIPHRHGLRPNRPRRIEAHHLRRGIQHRHRATTSTTSLSSPSSLPLNRRRGPTRG